MKSLNIKSFLCGVMSGILFTVIFTPKPASAGTSVWESAVRMATALERIANVMEKKP